MLDISAKGKFNPDTDIPAQTGKVFLITGGTSGLGAGSVREIAKHGPAKIFFTGRNAAAADALIESVGQRSPGVQLEFIECDQMSLASVRAAAEKFKQRAERLDVLMLNAGVMALPEGLTQDGYEQQFGVMVLAHAQLVKALLPTLTETARGGDVRVVGISSFAHFLSPSRGIEFDGLKTTQGRIGNPILGPRWVRYGQAKLGNMLYAEALAKRHPELMSVSVHPGYVFNELWGKVPLWVKLPAALSSIGKTVIPEEGHYNQTWAATCPKEQLTNGAYYVPFCEIGKKETAAAKDPAVADKLWQWTEEQLAGL